MSQFTPRQSKTTAGENRVAERQPPSGIFKTISAALEFVGAFWFVLPQQHKTHSSGSSGCACQPVRAS
jgi:hypothetical protein